MTVRQFLERRAQGIPMTLLDVREEWEVRLAPAPSTYLHIPMGQVPERMQEMDPGAQVVVMCRSGGRSMEVARFLQRAGFATALNLQGGILAWSRDVDPTIPVY
ncbi:MAG: rhodanese-like domain-containing protein [Steroidobacterales bacterium]